jgi:hypothetical protein
MDNECTDKIKAYKYFLDYLNEENKQKISTFSIFYLPEIKKEIRVLMSKTSNVCYTEKTLIVSDLDESKFEELKSNFTEDEDMELRSIMIDRKWVNNCIQLFKQEEELITKKNLLFFSSPSEESLKDIISREFDEGFKCFKLKEYKIGRNHFLKCVELLINNQTCSTYNTSIYNIACCYSLEDNFDCAIEWFDNAFQNGYNNWVHAIVDVDFLRIRNDPRFVEIIRKMKQLNPVRSKTYHNVNGILNPIDAYLIKHGIDL